MTTIDKSALSAFSPSVIDDFMFECPITGCGRRFAGSGTLRKHLKMNKGLGGSIQPRCNKLSRTLSQDEWSAVKDYYFLKKTNIPPDLGAAMEAPPVNFDCPLCMQSFILEDSVRRHLRPQVAGMACCLLLNTPLTLDAWGRVRDYYFARMPVDKPDLTSYMVKPHRLEAVVEAMDGLIVRTISYKKGRGRSLKAMYKDSAIISRAIQRLVNKLTNDDPKEYLQVIFPQRKDGPSSIRAFIKCVDAQPTLTPFKTPPRLAAARPRVAIRPLIRSSGDKSGTVPTIPEQISQDMCCARPVDSTAVNASDHCDDVNDTQRMEQQNLTNHEMMNFILHETGLEHASDTNVDADSAEESDRSTDVRISETDPVSETRPEQKLFYDRKRTQKTDLQVCSRTVVQTEYGSINEHRAALRRHLARRKQRRIRRRLQSSGDESGMEEKYS